MDRERLYEESAACARAAKESKFYTAFKVIAIICFAVFGFQLFMSFPYVTSAVNAEGPTLVKVINIVIWFVSTFLIFFMGLAFFLLKNRFNVSYDYSFVEDEIRFTKIFNGKRRKFLTTVNMDQILKIGYCDKPSYENTLRGMKGKKPRVLTPNKEPQEGKMFIYLLVSTTIERKLYVLECKKDLLEYLVYGAGRMKFERE